MWTHERLLVYGKSLDAAVQLDEVARRIRGRPDLRTQLQRASASIPLNIAEGANEFSLPEKARFYRIARRSAAECISILDIAERLVPGATAPPATRALLNEVAAMLTRLVKARPER